MQEKWDRIYAGMTDVEAEPCWALRENDHLLPKAGDALDLACGLGGNALFLARHGLAVSAWDISSVAVKALSAKAAQQGLAVRAQVRDVETEAFPLAAFDVVVVSRFLTRSLARPIIDSLKPGGLLFYQTFVRDKPGANGPSNPAYLLAENELLMLFQALRVVVYREEGRIGDTGAGWRDEACFIGQKSAAEPRA
jgi:SAM-dependent methyltransferase